MTVFDSTLNNSGARYGIVHISEANSCILHASVLLLILTIAGDVEPDDK